MSLTNKAGRGLQGQMKGACVEWDKTGVSDPPTWKALVDAMQSVLAVFGNKVYDEQESSVATHLEAEAPPSALPRQLHAESI